MPADVPKDSSGFDPGVATVILAASGQVRDPLADTAVLGELGLDGGAWSTRGIIGKILVGKRHGLQRFIAPADNFDRAVLVLGVTLVPVRMLSQLHDYLNGKMGALTTDTDSAAGGHNLLLGGQPGTGKGMLARTLPGLLPGLSREEMLEVIYLHSLAGSDFSRPVLTWPFRAPHYNASTVAIAGGGNNLRP